MKELKSLQEIVTFAMEHNSNISDIVIDFQAKVSGETKEQLKCKMKSRLNIMKESVEKGLNPALKSASRFVGGGGCKILKAENEKNLIECGILNKAISYSVAVAEYNACMGRIVASPTAGSCGIIPGVLFSIAEYYKIDDEKIMMSMFTTAGIGMVIANRASLSGAEGGCQAECGSASAMAAAAAVELMGGTAEQAETAVAIALKCIMGLVCDPVAGLVECPCVKRNASCAANAITAANMALAGIYSIIPADEVMDAMKSVGNLMSPTLKETSLGGIANSPTARYLQNILC